MTGINVTFVGLDGNETTICDAETGRSLMEVAKSHGIAGIAGDCGGACACATCHVYIDEAWRAKVGEPDEIEAEMLDLAGATTRPDSRLSCQIVLGEDLEGLRVTVAPEA